MDLRSLIGACCIAFCAVEQIVLAGNAGETKVDRRWSADGPGGIASFSRHVQPLLGKLGCNGRACHGSFQGQGGFRLSLFGSDPQMDFAALVKRLEVAKPDGSLILLKPTRTADHEGGKRFERGSWPYRLLREWINAGAPFDASPSRLRRLEIIPSQAVLASGKAVTLRLIAHFDDETHEDVTALTQFSTNDEAIAKVTETGTVTAAVPGDTAIVATFGGSVATTHVLVPLVENERRSFTFPANNRIDDLVAAKWKLLGYEPSELSTDAEFLRRVSLDLIGTLPAVDEVREFLADNAPQKRAKKIDELLDRPEYASYWATKFSDLTGNDSAATPPPAAKTAWLWHGWLEAKLRANVPYDNLVAGFVTATTREGRPIDDVVTEYKQVASDIMPPFARISGQLRADWDGKDGFVSAAYNRRATNDLFWRTYDNAEKAALQLSYAFLGLRLECAQCHKHPYDRWTQQDFRGFTAFFANVRRGVPEDAPSDVLFSTGDERKRALIYRFEEVSVGQARTTGQKQKGVIDPNSKLPTLPRILGGDELAVSADEDSRTHLMAWMRDRDNPFFTPALVNRLWAHYFGAGLFEPTDELSAANPPSNPQLLDWLARDFIDHHFDLKHLHRTILNSRVYQLSWKPQGNNLRDEQNFTHARLRRLPAEVLVDALDQVTGGRTEAYAWKGKTYSTIIAPEGTRAISLAPTRLGQARGAYTLEAFGRPMRSERCDAERNSNVTLSQALYLLYDDDVQNRIAAADGRLARLLKSTSDNRKVIQEMYLSTVSRLPTTAETTQALEYVSRTGNRQVGFEDVLWTLVNLREFTFNH